MLKLLRKKKVAKRIFYVLAIIIIPAFVIWGSSSVINKSKTPNYAGIVFGKQVSFDEFRDALRAWKTQLKLQYGEKAEQIAAALFDPTQAAWDRIILLQEAKRRKIHVTDADVIDMLTSLPFLQKDGKFDPQTYDLFAKYSLGEEPRLFEEQLRENLQMAAVFGQITRDVKVSDEEIRKEYERQNVQRRVKYVYFAANGYKDKVSVTDEEVRAFYEKSKEKFKVPPQINVAYIGAEYDEKTSDEQKKAITDKLTKALSLARSKGLEETAKELNLKFDETGFFGFEDPIPTLGWMPQLSGLLFDLQEGTLSKIVDSGRGVYLFKIREKKAARIPEFKEVKEKTKDALIGEKSKELAAGKAKEFLDSLKNQSPLFESTAQTSGLTVKETPFFSHESYIPELGMAQPIKDAAFVLKDDAIAQNTVEMEQGFYVLKSTGSVPFDEEKFKKEKDEFAKNLLEQKRNKVFDGFVDDLKKRADLVSYVPATKQKI